MYIKAQSIIPAGTKITKLAPSVGKAKSVYSLERAQEKKLEQVETMKVRAQKFAAALKVGFTAEEALKLIQK